MDLLSFLLPNNGRAVSVSSNAISAQNAYSGSKSAFEDFFQSSLNSKQTNNSKELSVFESDSEPNSNSSKFEVKKAINKLDIPNEQKEQLKKELNSLETEEDAVVFLENLEKILMMNGISVSETVEQFVNSFVAEDGENTAPEISSFDSAMLKALKAKGFTQAEQKMTNKDAETAFEKLKVQADEANNLSETKVKVAEVLKPQVSEEISVDEQLLNTTATKPSMEVDGNAHRVGTNFLTEQQDNIEAAEIKTVSARDINKIADFVQYAKNGEIKKLTVQLLPKELGKLNIELVEQAGKISVKVTMESDQAKNLFVNNAESIRQQLEAKGIVLEKMELFFAEKDSRDGTNQQFFAKKNSGGKNSFSSEDYSDEETDPSKGLYA